MENNSCVLCLESTLNTQYIEYNHCGKYYLHINCYDELISNFKNQCIICRKKVKLIYKDNNLQFDEQIQEEEFQENEIVDIENQIITENIGNNNNIIKCCKLCVTSTIIICNFYILSYLFYVIK